MLQLSFFLIVLGILIIIIAAFRDGKEWLAWLVYSGKAAGRVYAVRDITEDSRIGAVEKVLPDGRTEILDHTVDQDIPYLLPFYRISRMGKKGVILEWQACGSLWRGHYRYLQRDPKWEPGSLREIHYSPEKPWQFAVKDSAPIISFLLKLIAGILVICLGAAAAAHTVRADASKHISYPGQSNSFRDMVPPMLAPYEIQLNAVSAENGSDYPIVWDDPGMEAHIRFLLNKPEGDILHSDVRNVQFLCLSAGKGAGRDHDILLTKVPEGYEGFTRDILYDRNFWRILRGNQIQEISTLSDLKHFDCLQLFSISGSQNSAAPVDLSGLSACRNLRCLDLQYIRNVDGFALSKLPMLEYLMVTGSPVTDIGALSGTPLSVLELYNCSVSDPEQFRKLTGLRSLSLFSCGNIETAPFAAMNQLDVLELYGSIPDSLQVLTSLTGLRYLSVTPYPGMEIPLLPELEGLDLSMQRFSNTASRPLTYDALSRMHNLKYLDLAFHQNLTTDDCIRILRENPGLTYLSIPGTPAAKDTTMLDAGKLKVFVYSE